MPLMQDIENFWCSSHIYGTIEIQPIQHVSILSTMVPFIAYDLFVQISRWFSKLEIFGTLFEYHYHGDTGLFAITERRKLRVAGWANLFVALTNFPCYCFLCFLFECQVYAMCCMIWHSLLTSTRNKESISTAAPKSKRDLSQSIGQSIFKNFTVSTDSHRPTRARDRDNGGGKVYG